MHKLIAAVFLSAGLLGAAAMAADAMSTSATGELVTGEAIQVTAEVVAVDMKSRKVTLKTADGAVSSLVAGPEVTNLAQVKPGDRVVARYSQALTMHHKKGPGVRVSEESLKGGKSAPGERPAAATTRTVHFVADVTAVDAKAGKISVKSAKGQTYELAVKDKSKLSGIAVGDQVEGTFLQVAAIAVVPREGKK